MELVKAMDDYIPEPKRDLDKPFLMPIEDVFSIKGRGTVATGRIEQGIIKINDEVEIVGIKHFKDCCYWYRRFKKTLTKDKLVTMPVFSSVVLSVMTSSVVRSCKARYLLLHTQSLKQKYTS